MTEERHPNRLLLTEACWPAFELMTNFSRQLEHGIAPDPEQLRYEALSALRDGDEIVRDDPFVERAWLDRMKAAIVYFIDYKLINGDWDGRLYWLDNAFETDPVVLGEPEALGGQKFFATCDELQREYETAERRNRTDKTLVGEQLGVLYTCLRLGFRGQYDDRPQELADYTRRLYVRLPAHATTRGREMFPQAYEHTEELQVHYDLGMKLTVVLICLAIVVGGWMAVAAFEWDAQTKELVEAATKIET